MSSIAQIDAAVGQAMTDVYAKMQDLLGNTTMDAGEKSKALLDAQGQLQVVQGASHAIGQAYSMTGRIGQ